MREEVASRDLRCIGRGGTEMAHLCRRAGESGASGSSTPRSVSRIAADAVTIFVMENQGHTMFGEAGRPSRRSAMPTATARGHRRDPRRPPRSRGRLSPPSRGADAGGSFPSSRCVSPRADGAAAHHIPHVVGEERGGGGGEMRGGGGEGGKERGEGGRGGGGRGGGGRGGEGGERKVDGGG